MTHHRIESLEAFAGRLTGVVLILLTLIGVTIAASGPQDTPSSDIILAVEDDGGPALSSYRRIILTIRRR